MWPNVKYKGSFLSFFLSFFGVNGGGKVNPKKETKAE
jgi:hypothetical protein